jgi:hypothetical protein
MAALIWARRSATLTAMEITVRPPDVRAQRSEPGPKALEPLFEDYRPEALTGYQTSRLLGLSRLELDAFLKNRGLLNHAYALDDLEQDLETFGKLEDQGLLPRVL